MMLRTTGSVLVVFWSLTDSNKNTLHFTPPQADKTMVLRTTGSVLVVFWSLTVVLGTNDWGVTYTTQTISALMGSTVEMSCSYTFPSGTVTSTFWFIKYDANWKPVSLIEDPDYKDRVIYHSDDENGHKVTIKDLRKSDSAVYMFRFITDGDKYTGSPGISLSVTDGPKNTSVSVIPSGEIVEGSSVTLTCSSDANPPVDKYTWYKKTVTSPKASGQSYSITNIRPEDSGEYYCEAENGVGSNNSTALMIITESPALPLPL